MSIVPLMFRDWWDEWDRPSASRLLDQHFGLGLHRDELLSSLSALPSTSLLRNSYFRPWRPNLLRQESASTINFTKDKFEVILDVQQFAPEEITVKASNNSVVVEGKHEEKPDEHGYISRQFTRRYILPQDYEVQDLVSTLSTDGVLTITAPKRSLPGSAERIVPIYKTGPAKPTVPIPPARRETNVPIVTSPEPPRRETNIPIVTSPEPPKRETNIPIFTSPEPPRRETNIPIVTSPEPIVTSP